MSAAAALLLYLFVQFFRILFFDQFFGLFIFFFLFFFFCQSKHKSKTISQNIYFKMMKIKILLNVVLTSCLLLLCNSFLLFNSNLYTRLSNRFSSFFLMILLKKSFLNLILIIFLIVSIKDHIYFLKLN